MSSKGLLLALGVGLWLRRAFWVVKSCLLMSKGGSA